MERKGVDQLVQKWLNDPSFRDKMKRDPEGAVKSCGISLNAEEWATLRNLLFVHQTLGELNRFFHQPEHYPNIEAVREFLGSCDNGGGYDALVEAYYIKLRGMLPADVEELFTDGVFDHPLPPAYYRGGA